MRQSITFYGLLYSHSKNKLNSCFHQIFAAQMYTQFLLEILLILDLISAKEMVLYPQELLICFTFNIDGTL